MSLRGAETIYVDVGIARKRRLKKASKATKLSQAKLVRAAIDKELAQLATIHPQLQERNGARSNVTDGG